MAVANLWDVTDRDIDRYSKALLAAWLRKAGASGEGAGGGGAAEEVAESREACRLPSLIGAAPVCYGRPAWVAVGASARAPVRDANLKPGSVA